MGDTYEDLEELASELDGLPYGEAAWLWKQRAERILGGLTVDSDGEPEPEETAEELIARVEAEEAAKKKRRRK